MDEIKPINLDLMTHFFNLDNYFDPSLVKYRYFYDRILFDLCKFSWQSRIVNIDMLIRNSYLSSGPTLQKRINELVLMGLIQSIEVTDRRMRALTITNLGKQYLKALNDLLTLKNQYSDEPYTDKLVSDSSSRLPTKI